ncbi:MAG: hypothetical protein QXK54_07225 [Ignisphaera sp.]
MSSKLSQISIPIIISMVVIASVAGIIGYIAGGSRAPVTYTHTYVLTSPVTSTKTVTETTTSILTSTLISTLREAVETTHTITMPTTYTQTVTITRTITALPQQTVVPEGSRLFYFYLPWDDSIQTDISLADYLHKPAGKYGHVYVGSDGRLYVGNQRIRFLGVSVVGPGAFPTKEEAELIAARLAKFGVNLVRFHALDANWEPYNNIFSPPGTTRLNPTNLDRMDYFVAQLKKNGIYININLMCYRQFSSADGLPSEVNIMAVKDQHILPFFYEPARKLVKDFARALLTHVNPYTGLSYAEDPAVAMIEILNEYGATFGWLDGAVDRLPKVFRDALREKWNQFLIEKYGTTENLVKAWGSDSILPGENLESRTVDVFDLKDLMLKRPSQRAREDWAEFLWRLDYEYFMDMYNFLKNELGVKALIVGTQSAWGGMPNIMAQLDIVDAHHYWRYPVGSGNIWYVQNDAMVNFPESNTLSQLAFRSVYGKPFTISEYNHPAPNMYRAEGFVFLSAYGALQDWDALMPYSYGPYTSGHIAMASWNSMMMRGTLDFDQDPARWAMMITAFMLFVRGDVSPAKHFVAIEMDREIEIQLVATQRASAWNMPNGVHLNIPYYVPLIHRARLVVANTTKPVDALSPRDVKPPEGSIIKSDTGELIWDCRDAGRCVFIVNTSRSIVLTGFISGKKFDLGDIVIEVKDTLLDGWATIALHVLEGTSFRDARKILIITIGAAFNNNMPIYNFDNRQLLFRTSLNLTKDDLSNLYGRKISNFGNWGRGPTIVEGIEATISIKTNRNIIAWSLDNIGRKTRSLTVVTRQEYKDILLLPTHGTIWYQAVVY